MATPDLAIDAAPADLPAPYAAWLTPDTPLPDEVIRIPRRLRPPAAMRRVQTLSPLLLAAGLLVVASLVGSGLDQVPVALCALPLAMALAAAGAVLFLGARRELAQHALEAAGQRRSGLFLGPDALLLRMDDNRCHLVPRENIRSVATDRARHPYWPTPGTRVTLIAARDETRGVRLQFWSRDLRSSGAPPAERIAVWAGVEIAAEPA